MHYGSWDPRVYLVTAYVMFNALSQLAGCFIAHLCGGALRMDRSMGALQCIIWMWYALCIHLHLPPHLRFFVTQLTPISLPPFWTILVMYCISYYHRLGIRITRYSKWPRSLSLHVFHQDLQQYINKLTILMLCVYRPNGYAGLDGYVPIWIICSENPLSFNCSV